MRAPSPKKKSSPRQTSRNPRMTISSRSAPGAEEVLCLEEPLLEFAGGRCAVDPHDGLALNGPYSLDKPSHPATPL
jgi:hypothetical protein